MSDDGHDAFGLGLELEPHAGDDESGEGIELDDFQATEIRQIFLTTLPEYLEPVRQMVEQLLSGGEGALEVLHALDTTLRSIAQAAERVGIDDVRHVITELQSSAKRIETEPDDEAATRLKEGLAALERLAESGGGDISGADRGETIVAAFKQLPGVKPQVLEKMTAAGLVFVSQVLQATPDEVAAVSGLDRKTVDDLIARLRARGDGTHSGAKPNARSEGLLGQYIARQVEAEFAVDEARGGVLKARTLLARLEAEVAEALTKRDELRANLSQTKEAVARRLAEKSVADARHTRVERERDESLRALQEMTERLAKLRRDQRVLTSDYTQYAGNLSQLTERVEKLLVTLGERDRPGR